MASKLGKTSLPNPSWTDWTHFLLHTPSVHFALINTFLSWAQELRGDLGKSDVSRREAGEQGREGETGLISIIHLDRKERPKWVLCLEKAVFVDAVRTKCFECHSWFFKSLSFTGETQQVMKLQLKSNRAVWWIFWELNFKHWDRLPSEVFESQSLEVLERGRDVVLT